MAGGAAGGAYCLYYLYRENLMVPTATLKHVADIQQEPGTSNEKENAPSTSKRGDKGGKKEKRRVTFADPPVTREIEPEEIPEPEPEPEPEAEPEEQKKSGLFDFIRRMFGTRRG